MKLSYGTDLNCGKWSDGWWDYRHREWPKAELRQLIHKPIIERKVLVPNYLQRYFYKACRHLGEGLWWGTLTSAILRDGNKMVPTKEVWIWVVQKNAHTSPWQIKSFMKTDELLKPLGSAQLGSKFCQNEFSLHENSVMGLAFQNTCCFGTFASHRSKGNICV